MSVTCVIFGHNFNKVRTERREVKEDENDVLVDVSVKKCNRCGREREEKVRTKIRDEDEKDSHPDDNNKSEPSSSDFSKGASDKPIYNESDGGIMLKDNSGQQEALNQSDVEDKYETGDKEDETDFTRVVECDECGFSRNVSNSSKRSGDVCARCGGWLTIRDNRNSTEYASTEDGEARSLSN